MAFAWLMEIARQVTQYSNFVGQTWYILTFVFRLVVVTSLGSAVYGDEQSNFVCNNVNAGCNNACYNQFTTISHLKFWAFQLLAVTGPVVIFHFFASYMKGEYEKIKHTQAALDNDESETFYDDRHRQYEANKMRRRQKVVGKVKTKNVYKDGKLEQIPINDKIRFVYYISVVLRLVTEGVFLYLTYTLYNYATPKPDCSIEYAKTHLDTSACYTEGTGLDFLWAEFPEFYRCVREEGLRVGVSIACHQNLVFGGYVPCWTSRAWEKTIFLRYMNVAAAICFCLCAVEIFLVPLLYYHHKTSKNKVRIVFREDSHPKELIDLPPKGALYSASHARSDYPSHAHAEYPTHAHAEYPSHAHADYPANAHADYPSRPASYYEERGTMTKPQRPQHPPPNETNVKRYEYQA